MFLLHPRQLARRTHNWLEAGGWRRIRRWLATGGVCTLLQFLLAWILVQSIPIFWAGAIAYAVSGQVSFIMNSVFTWSDRHPDLHFGLKWLKVYGLRWVKYCAVNWSAAFINGSIQSHVVANVGGFFAFVAANAVSAPYNLIMLDKVVFRHDEPPTELVKRNEN